MRHHRNEQHRPLSPRLQKLIRRSLWVDGFMIVISVFSLAREALAASWPLWRAVGHSAVLVAFGCALAGSLVLLDRRSGRDGSDDPAERLTGVALPVSAER